MKFTTVLFAGFAALSQAKAEAQPAAQPDIFEDIDSLVDSVRTRWEEASGLFEDIKTRIESADSASREAILSDAIASVTAALGSEYASWSLVAATATGSEYSEATEAIARYSDDVEGIIAEVSQVVTNSDDEEGKGAVPSFAVAMAGIIGGAALIANL